MGRFVRLAGPNVDSTANDKSLLFMGPHPDSDPNLTDVQAQILYLEHRSILLQDELSFAMDELACAKSELANEKALRKKAEERMQQGNEMCKQALARIQQLEALMFKEGKEVSPLPKETDSRTVKSAAYHVDAPIRESIYEHGMYPVSPMGKSIPSTIMSTSSPFVASTPFVGTYTPFESPLPYTSLRVDADSLANSTTNANMNPTLTDGVDRVSSVAGDIISRARYFAERISPSKRDYEKKAISRGTFSRGTFSRGTIEVQVVSVCHPEAGDHPFVQLEVDDQSHSTRISLPSRPDPYTIHSVEDEMVPMKFSVDVEDQGGHRISAPGSSLKVSVFGKSLRAGHRLAVGNIPLDPLHQGSLNYVVVGIGPTWNQQIRYAVMAMVECTVTYIPTASDPDDTVNSETRSRNPSLTLELGSQSFRMLLKDTQAMPQTFYFRPVGLTMREGHLCPKYPTGEALALGFDDDDCSIWNDRIAIDVGVQPQYFKCAGPYPCEVKLQLHMQYQSHGIPAYHPEARFHAAGALGSSGRHYEGKRNWECQGDPEWDRELDRHSQGDHQEVHLTITAKDFGI